MLLTQPNDSAVSIPYQWHVLPLPRCCPVSGNPQPGSVIAVLYTPASFFLEVYSLRKLVDAFVGGRDPVRDMEGMIQTIARECADAVRVPVTVGAFVRLQRGDSMVVIAQA